MVNEIADEQTTNSETPKEVPVIPIDDLVVFPYMPPVPPFSPHHMALSGETVTAAVDDTMINGLRTICVFKQLKETDAPTDR